MPAPLKSTPRGPSLFALLFADAPNLQAPSKPIAKPRPPAEPCPDCDLRLTMSL